MNSFKLQEDVLLSGMKAWNTIIEIFDGTDSTFDDVETFNEFYLTIMEKLLEESEEE